MPEKTRAEELHDEHRRKVWDDLKSGSESFDKYLLTFSGGALALSLGFLKDVVKPNEATGLPWLLASWICFVLCILSTLISFQVSIGALERMVPALDDFYLKGEAEAFNKHLKSLWTKGVGWCAYFGIGIFVVGLACTIVFAYSNLREARAMSKDEPVQRTITGQTQKAVKPVAMSYVTDAIAPVAMTPVNSSGDERGLKPVSMTPTVQSNASGQAGSAGNGSGQTDQQAKK